MILFAVGDINLAILRHDRGRIDDLRTEHMAPDAFARADFHGVDGTVGGARDEQPLPADDGDHRIRVVGPFESQRRLEVVGRRRPPDHLARFGIDGHEAVRTAGLIAPRTVDEADDDEAAVEDRRSDAPAVARNAAEFFGELPLPQRLAGLGVQADEKAGRRLREDGACGGVGRERSPAEPARRDVGEEDAERSFPNELAGVRIEALDAFDFGRLRGVGPVDDVELTAHHERGGAAAEGLLPLEVALAHGTEVEGGRETRFLRLARLFGPAPVDPVGSRGGGRGDQCDEEAETGCPQHGHLQSGSGRECRASGPLRLICRSWSSHRGPTSTACVTDVGPPKASTRPTKELQ